MFAKRPNIEQDDKERSNSPMSLTVGNPVAELSPPPASEELVQLRDNQTPDRAKLLVFPSRVQPTWPDYEELFPATEAEPTEPLVKLSSELINRRCYYHPYWPQNTVFRIKEVDTDNQTVYINLIYRWVSTSQIRIIKNRMPQRPPRGIELEYLLEEDDCSDF